jgi:lipopolysaccharide biosynthesis protein
MVRAIAFYLPQFHPIPENDRWWGKGFTEWTNVAKARPLFRGHYQPRIPADLGFYDLRMPETREAQAALARQYGIEAFCYWHYWFGNGVRILEKVFEEVLTSGSPSFPFCLGWANETWTGIWHGAPDRILIEQKYPGCDDYRRHFDYLLRAFRDPRYVRVEGKPLFLVYRPQQVPECSKVLKLWRNLAAKAGLAGLHLVAWAPSAEWNPAEHGFDGGTFQKGFSRLHWLQRARRKLENCPVVGRGLKRVVCRPLYVHSYRESMIAAFQQKPAWDFYPVVLPNWDNTPRSGRNGVVLVGSTPELFRIHLREALTLARENPPHQRILFLKSWNEWAEGNYLEPDQEFGHAYLKVVREEIAAASGSIGGVGPADHTKTGMVGSHQGGRERCPGWTPKGALGELTRRFGHTIGKACWPNQSP